MWDPFEFDNPREKVWKDIQQRQLDQLKDQTNLLRAADTRGIVNTEGRQ
jgi:hypothetical protein